MKKSNIYIKILNGVASNQLWLVIIISLVASIFFNQTDRADTFIKMNLFVGIMVVALLGIVVGTIYSSKKSVKQLLDTEKILFFIMISGYILRLIYVLFTSVVTRQNDAGTFIPNEGGHLGYMYYLYDNNALPDFDPRTYWQYYHPPLHYTIESMWLKCNNLIGISTDKMVENIQIPTLVYSTCILIVINKITAILKIKPFSRIMIAVFMAFYPYFVMLSGAVNNDALVTLLMILCIQYMLEWFYEPKTYTIVLVAITLGFAMMTKISAVLMAPAMAILFLWRLVDSINKKDKLKMWEYIKQYLIFGIISIPVGIWYPIKNLVEFNIPLNYVPALGDNSLQFLGEHSWFDRIFSITPGQLVNYYMTWDGTATDCTYNIFLSLLKFGAFNEQNSGLNDKTSGKIVGYSLLLVLFVLTVIVIFLAIRWLTRYKVTPLQDKGVASNDKAIRVFFSAVIVIMFLSYVSFCFQYKHICTMNIRYVLVPVILCVIGAGKGFDLYMKNNEHRAVRLMSIICWGLIVFSMLSIISFRSMLGV